MTTTADPDERFAADFAARCPGLAARIECDADRPFLLALFVACSPLGPSLPQPMIEQQARFQNQAYLENYPTASRWIIWREARPIGRMIVDWNIDGTSHCIDVAITPDEQGEGIGTALLSIWIEISDGLDRTCFLQVAADSRAKDLYSRLRFVATGDPYQPSIAMFRPDCGSRQAENR